MLFIAAESRRRLFPILLGQGIGVACGVLGVKVNSHFLPPDVLGAYGVFLTFAPLGMWVVHVGLIKFVSRHWAASPDRPALRLAVLRAWVRRLPWLAIAAVAAAWSMQSLQGRVLLPAVALFSAAGCLALAGLAQAALQADRAHWRDCTVAAGSAVTRTFLPPVLYLATTSVAALWLGFAAHACIAAALGAIVTSRYARNPGTTGATRSTKIASVYEGPLFVTLAIAGWALTGLNRWLVAACFGETEAGYFTLAGGAATVVASTIGTVFLQYFQPGFFATADSELGISKLDQRVDRVALAFTGTAIAAVGALALVAPSLVGPLISVEYRPALEWILPVGMFTIATTIAIFYQTYLLAARRESACGPVELTTAALLATGCIAAALSGPVWLMRWLLVTPIIPWLVTRTLARRFVIRPATTA